VLGDESVRESRKAAYGHAHFSDFLSSVIGLSCLFRRSAHPMFSDVSEAGGVGSFRASPAAKLNILLTGANPASQGLELKLEWIDFFDSL
jgi:hypothetical protein